MASTTIEELALSFVFIFGEDHGIPKFAIVIFKGWKISCLYYLRILSLFISMFIYLSRAFLILHYSTIVRKPS